MYNPLRLLRGRSRQSFDRRDSKRLTTLLSMYDNPTLPTVMKLVGPGKLYSTLRMMSKLTPEQRAELQNYFRRMTPEALDPLLNDWLPEMRRSRRIDRLLLSGGLVIGAIGLPFVAYGSTRVYNQDPILATYLLMGGLLALPAALLMGKMLYDNVRGNY